MSRFAGDFQGPCTACGEYVEFALGIRTDGPTVAMHFGPGGPQPRWAIRGATWSIRRRRLS